MRVRSYVSQENKFKSQSKLTFQLVQAISLLLCSFGCDTNKAINVERNIDFTISSWLAHISEVVWNVLNYPTVCVV